MATPTSIDVHDTWVGEDARDAWIARGIQEKTLEQSPRVSLRASAVPRPRLGRASSSPLMMLETLGEGGMGIVRLARQRSLHREVAVKTLKSADSERARDALLSEALVTGALQHPNIIPVYAIDEDESGAPLIVMKRVEGVSWSALIHDEAPLPPDAGDALDWHLDVLAQVAGAIEFAHRRGILHRDLKPENVMIGELGEVYVLDWGLGVSLREEDRGLIPLASDVAGVGGTPAYMAPEMLEGNGARLGPHTDVYLLGATLHEILVREPRHAGEQMMAVFSSVALSDPFDYPREVPAELASIASRACAREPADRYGSAEAFRAAVVAFRHHRSSIRLSDEAGQRLARMKELVRESRDDVDHQREVRDLFGAARFGFEQALAAWPDNAAASAGAREAIDTIVRFELTQRNLAAARSYLDAIEQPPAELTGAVEKLAGELEAEQREYQLLREKAQQSDRRLGASSRAAVGLAFGVCAAGSLIGIQWADERGILPISSAGYLGWLAALGVGSLLALRTIQSFVRVNEVHRQIVVGTLASVAAIATLRFVVVLSDIPIAVGFRLELVLYALALTMLGVITSYRVLAAAALFALGALVDAWLDRGDLYVMAATVFAAFSALSWVWASSAKRPPVEPA